MTGLGSTLYKLKAPSVFPSTTKNSNYNTRMNLPNIGSKKISGNMERYFSPKNQRRILDPTFRIDGEEMVADGKKM